MQAVPVICISNFPNFYDQFVRLYHDCGVRCFHHTLSSRNSKNPVFLLEVMDFHLDAPLQKSRSYIFRSKASDSLHFNIHSTIFIIGTSRIFYHPKRNILLRIHIWFLLLSPSPLPLPHLHIKIVYQRKHKAPWWVTFQNRTRWW